MQGIVVRGTTLAAHSNDYVQTVAQHSLLLCLPNELLDSVLTNLPCQDINDLRLHCRQARMKTFPFWSRSYFRTRQFMIDAYSLQTLVDISRHPQLSRVLTHLVIGVDEIDTKDTLAYIRASKARNPHNRPSLFQYWRDAASAQQALLNTGRAIDLLSSAMAHLPNLDKVSVSGSKLFAHAPYYSKTFHYLDLGMRSYGSSAHQMQPRHTTSGMPNSKGFIDRVFNVVLNSLVRSAPKITSLQTRLSNDDTLNYMDDEAFNLLPLAPMQTSAATVLGSLTELHLEVSLESQLLEKVDNLIEHDHIFNTSNFGLRRLLGLARNLQCLTLKFVGGETIEGHCDFTAWLSEPAGRPLEDAYDGNENASSKSHTSVAWNPPPISLPFLRRLVLQGLFISPGQLRATFTKFHDLKSAALQGVYLRRCFIDSPPVPEYSDEMENTWAEFFRGSHSALSNLESLELHNLATMQYREDPIDGVSVASKDVDLVVFVPEEGGAEFAHSFMTVTNFGRDALHKLAGQIRLGRDLIAAVDQ
ncbi:hypothetical protein FJTKL_06947 [Diaporthe vaccinii]|uniref:F-box domain-containing protein n=1 Tax=Diaporthe vaccinii TaxID=105482 RepID=A0ABR4DPU7_9PEZI